MSSDSPGTVWWRLPPLCPCAHTCWAAVAGRSPPRCWGSWRGGSRCTPALPAPLTCTGRRSPWKHQIAWTQRGAAAMTVYMMTMMMMVRMTRAGLKDVGLAVRHHLVCVPLSKNSPHPPPHLPLWWTWSPGWCATVDWSALSQLCSVAVVDRPAVVYCRAVAVQALPCSAAWPSEELPGRPSELLQGQSLEQKTGRSLMRANTKLMTSYFILLVVQPQM